MTRPEENRKKPTAQIKIMIVLIVLMIVGIITRWDYICGELAVVWNNMFPAGR